MININLSAMEMNEIATILWRGGGERNRYSAWGGVLKEIGTVLWGRGGGGRNRYRPMWRGGELKEIGTVLWWRRGGGDRNQAVIFA